MAERIDAKIRGATRNENGCLIIGTKTYPLVRHEDGKLRRLSHAIMEQIIGRPIADNEHVLHSCDDPRCIEASHLRIGDHAENMADIARRGRAGGLKLSNDDVREIRRLKATGTIKQCDLAKQFGVTDGIISMIVNNKIRTHV